MAAKVFAWHISCARSNARLALARAISITFARYSACPRLAQVKASSKASVECSMMLATFSCASLARATDFSNTSISEDGSSARNVVTCSVICSAAFIAARLAREARVCIVSMLSLICLLLFFIVLQSSKTAAACAAVFHSDVRAFDQAASAIDLARSSTHASRANQRWLALQCGQYASAK